jgi:uncharacterized NAD(P)/FAD-binding protein YdhS
MTAEPKLPVAIVGGGFSGTMLAANLAKRGIASVLIDGSGRMGKGTAYSTDEPAHLLNIPAERMSAWPDDPDDFVRSIEAEGGSRHDFAERRRYGRYLRDILDSAIASGLVTPVEATALGAERHAGIWRIALDDGRTIETPALALAIGNQPPQGMPLFDGAGDRYVDDPWGPQARQAMGRAAIEGSTVLMIGTGLTMVDCALSLDAAGFSGRIVAMSRRGQLPRANAEGPAPRPSADIDKVPKASLRALTRWLRRESARIGFRDAVDSLRPHSHPLWQSLPPDQQRRFLRHVRAYWDVHRHRIAPAVARTIATMIADGRLEVMAARITTVAEASGELEIGYRRRGERAERSLRAAYAINCTGPLHAMSKTLDPLLASLLKSGSAYPDRLDIGLTVDTRSRVEGSDRLWALGALTKANYWEIIAVPDIRAQAAAVADDIAREMGR